MIEGWRYSKTYQKHGSEHYCAKLDETKVKKIRMEYAALQGGFLKLSKKYEVSAHTIQGVVYGLTWKHVGGPIQPPRRLQHD